MKSFFSSDYHLGHKNIIKYDGRPFKDVWEMDEEIIRRHNDVVFPGDDFYFLGDFCFNNRAEEYLERLNGNKFFIKGNHDRADMVKLYKRYGTYLGGLEKVVVNSQQIVLCHYQLMVWEKSHRGAWCLHGHSHHSLRERPDALCQDMGINGKTYNYFPQEFAEIQRDMKRKTWKSIDHHGE